MISEGFFEDIQQQLYNKLPFVAYRKPNEVSVQALLQNDNQLYVIEDFSESGFAFAPFDAENDAILIPLNRSESIESEYAISNTIDASYIAAEKNTDQRQTHLNLVKKGVGAILSDTFKKVVLSRCETVQQSDSDPIALFKKLLNNYKVAFVYCWYHPKVGLWLGATPETLCQIEGNKLVTMALAATQKYDGTLSVTWTSKEKEEQQLVTDFIVENIQTSVYNIKISDTKTSKAGHLLHLKTKITGTLIPQVSNLKVLLNKLHPTPAVCGLPKEKSKLFILDHENYNREFYTGFLGELNMKQKFSRNTNRRNVENNAYASIKTTSNLFVNLRCMQLKEEQALIYVGGGITKDSIPEDEWEETIIKAETMKRVLVSS